MGPQEKEFVALTSALETVATNARSAMVRWSPAAHTWPSRYLSKNSKASSSFEYFAGSGSAPSNVIGAYTDKKTEFCIFYLALLSRQMILTHYIYACC
jgi:hypothetical protein